MKTIRSEHMCVVDVRDTALAHLLAIKKPTAANIDEPSRYILCHSSPSFREFAAPVSEKYNQYGWEIS